MSTTGYSPALGYREYLAYTGNICHGLVWLSERDAARLISQGYRLELTGH
jgi:hypothetical protein